MAQAEEEDVNYLIWSHRRRTASKGHMVRHIVADLNVYIVVIAQDESRSPHVYHLPQIVHCLRLSSKPLKENGIAFQ